ncbi:MAG: GerMN domain-containing protein [Acidobacteria bacterium]|nr:GerMN domain-containing protein [Acidobacteriota bacterium]
MTPGRVVIGIAATAVAVALAWALMVGLGRLLRTTDPAVVDAVATPTAPASPADPPAVPRIRATLFFASENGQQLVPVAREVPLAEGVVAQARAIVEAQISEPPPEPLASTIPSGTTLRGIYLSEANEMFVDLEGTIRNKHPGGSMNEIFTVYTIVNAVTVNLPDVPQVQLLIDGREVDTLAGHVDLRRPLRKNEMLIQQ